MENKVKDNREEQRIAQDAKLYVINTHDICIDGRVIDHYTENQFHQHNEASYIAGATKEAERCKPLVKALYSAKETLGLAVLLDKSDTMQKEINEIEKALADYNKK